MVIHTRLFCAFALGPLVCYLLFGMPTQQFELSKQIALSVLVYPILEELAFRGFIQTSLLNYTRHEIISGLTYANVITSAMFSAVHLFAMSWDKAILVFLPSIIFGYFREVKNEVVTPISLHVFYNLNFIVFN